MAGAHEEPSVPITPPKRVLDTISCLAVLKSSRLFKIGRYATNDLNAITQTETQANLNVAVHACKYITVGYEKKVKTTQQSFLINLSLYMINSHKFDMGGYLSSWLL